MYKADYTIIKAMDFDPHIVSVHKVLTHRAGNPACKKDKRRDYIDIVTAFDIETSRIPEIDNSFMYVWQWAFNTDVVVMGRTWDEFLHVCKCCVEVCEEMDASIVVLVHNLSYEFCFLKGIYDFSEEHIIATAERKILKCDMFGGALEFRCSMLHSNYGLKAYTNKFDVKHKKLSGDEYNYNIVRTPAEELTDKEVMYCCHDVLGLVEAYTKEMKMDGDTLYTVPLTSTGYIRREVKAIMRQESHSWLSAIQPNMELYKLLRQAFRGGDTHASRYFSDMVITDKHGSIQCYDRSSSYPDTQVNCKFPMTPFKKAPVYDIKEEDLERWETLGYAYIISVHFENVRIKNYVPTPYIPLSKTRINNKAVTRKEDKKHFVLDNGRVLYADAFDMTITDVDYKIIKAQYDFTMKVETAYLSKYGYLPQRLRDFIGDYYRQKTLLKGNDEKKIEYDKIKNKFNAIYGMTAQIPVRDTIEYNGETKELESTDLDILSALSNKDAVFEALMKANKKAFNSYAWAVWCTAWARYRLFEGVCCLGKTWAEIAHKFIYCDTDSIYFIGNADFTAYNKERIKDSKKNGGVAVDAKGKLHYLGVMELDKSGIHAFKTLGAKKYVYEDDSGLHITIAGVVKGDGAKELGSIDNFKEGFTFVKSGGLCAVYNDNVDMLYNVNGEKIHITDNICLKPSTYTISITEEYRRLLEGIDIFGMEELI